MAKNDSKPQTNDAKPADVQAQPPAEKVPFSRMKRTPIATPTLPGNKRADLLCAITNIEASCKAVRAVLNSPDLTPAVLYGPLKALQGQASDAYYAGTTSEKDKASGKPTA